ncbi:MAG: Ig-like domain-containing protein [Melioribacteraceae bacterium]|nr:Ig-like domain-containing protein [Melioribacteraceae bacterium]
MKLHYQIKILMTVLLFVFTINANGQSIQHKKLEYSPLGNLLQAEPSEFLSEVIEIPIKNPEPFIAIGLNATLSNENGNIHFYIRVSENGDSWNSWMLIENDIEVGKIDNKYFGTLAFFDKNSRFMQFRTNALSDLEDLTFNFISPGKTDKSTIEKRIAQSKLSKTLDGIERPEFVSRKDWGCPQDENVSSRSLTDVTHLIIHHSAGNTVSNDFAAVVLAYWSYHVNGNGWDDIGYNWLVDPNGVLYKGRAWKSATEENVRGAHNSGKNSNTSGICLIGNYMSAIPSDSGLNKLASISAFLSDKYGIDPVGESYHNAIGRTNDNITGHGQSGGGTACPGTQMINRMQSIRELTFSKIIDITAAPEVLLTYPNAEVDSAYLSKRISIKFSHPMNQTSVESAFSITPSAFGTTSWNSDGNIIYFQPSSTLAKQTNYSVKIGKSAMSNWDVPLTEDIELDFVTKTSDNLSLIVNYPQNNDVDIETDVTIMVQFDGYLNPSSLGGNVLFLDSEENPVEIRVTTGGYSDGIIEFEPTSPLEDNKLYSIILKDGISTTDGYSFGKIETINFTTRSITSVDDFNNPETYRLISAYPNPFNPTTILEYQLKQSSHVSIKVYDIIGNLITTLVNGNVKAGTYKISFDANSTTGGLPSGVYFSQIVTNTDVKTIKLLLTK